jgi:hypothetical protein
MSVLYPYLAVKVSNLSDSGFDPAWSTPEASGWYRSGGPELLSL